MESFKGVSPHRPLDKHGKEIRIVRLLPNTFSAPIECELEHIILEPGADYEAISYCWGDASLTHPILLDGVSYPITLTLLDGLKYLRHTTSPRKLWIDSLCINQTDLAERSREILRMREIYKLAKSVVIWLGDYAPFTRLHEIAVRPRPYVKDLATSPELVCGDLVLPFAYLRAVDEYWVTNTEDKRIGLPPICPSLDRMRVIWYGHQSILSDGESSSLAQRLAWILALVSARFHATDQHDIVYGTLGLLEAESLPTELMPDYSKSPNEVLIECASYIISNSQILTILQYNSMKTKGLPTWVPDWRHDSWCPIVLGAEAPEGCHCRIIREIAALEVDIVAITEVSLVGPRLTYRDSAESLGNVWSNFLLDAEDSLGKIENEVWGYSSFGKALWKLLLVFDLSRQDLHEPGWHLGVAEEVPPLFFREARVSATTRRLQSCLIEEALMSIGASIADKYVFRGIDDSLGIMCQPNVRPNEHDMICTIKGSYGDFVLREYLDGYKIIGRCERNRRGNFTIGDIGIHRWAGTTHLYAFYERLWSDSDDRQILLY
ncbi:heterokaryon incompatibility protein-domain-containing protein [Xylaria bambusicola]|uniref:heterokaryon incompatibility protein-domain-containing protein n=1 Tax=Xylaria bambusicola TaxID=326684 RepID=UPI002008B4C3|nr:heterokaryon incompatibility protein-domain-containing protein [Xylaria bambusicola]KAI0508938.1 heterokaryon incompatibility protein-domain-containing protein [Xylaria bambusicola]